MSTRSSTLPIALALAAAAASAGIPVPGLRALVAAEGGGPLAAGLVMSLHVLGTLLGALLVGRLMMRARDTAAAARTLVLSGLALSAVLNAGMSLTSGSTGLLAGRLLDGAAHVAAIMGLMGAGAFGPREQRPRRMAALGATLVLGVGAGMALGGLATRLGARGGLAGAAILGVVGVLCALRIRFEGTRRQDSPVVATSPAAGDLIPGLVVLGERFAFGVLSVTLPFALSSPRRTGMLLGILMTTSVLVMPLARRLAARTSPRLVWQAGGAILAAALGLCAVPDFLLDLRAVLWAIAAGVGAGALFTAAVVQVAGFPEIPRRIRGMGMVHALGGVGFLFGALGAGLALERTGGREILGLPIAAAGAACVIAVLLIGCSWRMLRLSPVVALQPAESGPAA